MSNTFRPLSAEPPLNQKTSTVSSHAFATPSEAAAYLRLCRATIHKLIATGRIPAVRWGRAVRIPWAWLIERADPNKLASAQRP